MVQGDIADRWGTRAFGRTRGVFSAPVSLAVALAPAGGVAVASVVAVPGRSSSSGLGTVLAALVGLAARFRA